MLLISLTCNDNFTSGDEYLARVPRTYLILPESGEALLINTSQERLHRLGTTIDFAMLLPVEEVRPLAITALKFWF